MSDTFQVTVLMCLTQGATVVPLDQEVHRQAQCLSDETRKHADVLFLQEITELTLDREVC